jgi:hypothetical protein
MLLHLHANPLQIEPHPLQHIDCYALSKFDQSEQQVFSSHVVVVEPLGLLARKRQDLLGTRSKIIHHCVPLPGPLTLLKVDPTSAPQHLTSKPEEIEYCYDYLSISSRGFSPQSHKLTTHRKASQLLMHR